DAIADEDVLSERATLADSRTGTDMHPVPDARASSDLRSGVDDSRLMSFVVHVRISELFAPARGASRRSSPGSGPCEWRTPSRSPVDTHADQTPRLRGYADSSRYAD